MYSSSWDMEALLYQLKGLILISIILFSLKMESDTPFYEAYPLRMNFFKTTYEH